MESFPACTEDLRDLKSDDDFDFVFVSLSEHEKEVENLITDDEGDDGDSYDRCEDVYSLFSTNEGEDGDQKLSTSFKISSPTVLKDSILTVPSGMMKNLDEAHAAAKLTRIADIEKKELYESQMDEILLTSEKAEENSNSLSNVGAVESSSFSAGSLETLIINEIPSRSSRGEIFAPTVIDVNTKKLDSPLIDTVPRSLHSRITEKIVEQEENEHSVGSSNSIAASSCMSSRNEKGNKISINSISVSRTSNKKRRKKLRLLKKAQAAATAAQKISERYHNEASLPISSCSVIKLSSTNKQRSNSKKQVTPVRCSSKKVANIAVTCAMASMSNYRKELVSQGKQQYTGSCD